MAGATEALNGLAGCTSSLARPGAALAKLQLRDCVLHGPPACPPVPSETEKGQARGQVLTVTGRQLAAVLQYRLISITYVSPPTFHAKQEHCSVLAGIQYFLSKGMRLRAQLHSRCTGQPISGLSVLNTAKEVHRKKPSIQHLVSGTVSETSHWFCLRLGAGPSGLLPLRNLGTGHQTASRTSPERCPQTGPVAMDVPP